MVSHIESYTSTRSNINYIKNYKTSVSQIEKNLYIYMHKSIKLFFAEIFAFLIHNNTNIMLRFFV